MLPPNFQWIETKGVLPKLMSAAIQYLNVKEYPGVKANPVILEMAKGLGLEKIYKSDEDAWCALFMNHIIRISGKPLVDIKGVKENYLRARYLLNWGNKVEIGKEKFGDVIILSRDGGLGHTCLFVAKTPHGFVGLGANQQNSVRFSEFLSNRILGVRNYYETAPPLSAQQYVIDGLGQISTNEA
jgi:uncharacterized protein (TIGR02594 family)